MNDLLKTVDWRVLSEKFQLASLVLIGEWDDAERVMVKMGEKGDISKLFYREWPLFRWFRKTEQFKRAYQEVFGEEYKIIGKADPENDPNEKSE
ncbi:hypothetical protein [Methylophaga lonarensis]|uniref:hypothetical protein n=1 Tax=Methylophaga lonarensis TaxID=999151 RepID=UPI00058B5C02|nr:hypothetical protein [Methylophaga lonarensis]